METSVCVNVLRRLQGGVLVQHWHDRLFLTKDQKAHLRVPLQRHGGAGNDDLRPVIAAHGVNGDTLGLRHGGILVGTAG